MPPLTALLPPSTGDRRQDPAHDAVQSVLRVMPWLDPVVEAVGVDPRSVYVERFWLPVLGPTATLLLRRFADLLDCAPDGAAVNPDDVARSLGVGGLESRHTPLRRALRRGARFGLFRPGGPAEVAVRRAVGPVPQRLLAKLPEALREDHRAWERDHAARAPSPDRRARLLALDLAAQGEPADAVERRLLACRIHPAVAYESARWAASRCSGLAAPNRSSSSSRVRTPNAVPPFDR